VAEEVKVDARGQELRRLRDVGEVAMPRGGNQPMTGRVLDPML
jgi:hypothetical protein